MVSQDKWEVSGWSGVERGDVLWDETGDIDTICGNFEKEISTHRADMVRRID